MPDSVPTEEISKFGPFEVDRRSGELRKQGLRMRLQQQPFQVLVRLLDAPGEVVPREELRRQLWPADTFVDFDNSLNAAIAKLREALDDSATSPRFIETLPRRGYRFICPVDTREGLARQEERPPERSRRGRWLIALAAGAVAALLGLLLAFNVAGWRDRLLSRSRGPRIGSLAVLPVKNFSGDPAQEFFADGMTDALIAGLARIRNVKVISRTSAMHYKGTSESLPQIARELGVEGIVEASVTGSGGRVRIAAQLIDARQDRHLWARSYEGEMTDVLALQAEVVQAITDEIRAQLTPGDAPLATAHRVDPEVYDATLRGRMLLEDGTREDQFRQAIALFQTAVDRDPTYAPAWAGWGEAQWTLAAVGFEYVAPDEVRGKAIAAVERALQLDATLPEAHAARALIAADGEWDVAKAQQHFEKALELRPGYAAAHGEYGHLLGGEPLSRFAEARRHLDRARELDPLSPWHDINLLAWWLFQGQPQKALEEGERACERHPALWVAHWQTGFARLALGQRSEAAGQFEAALELLRPLRPAVALAPLGMTYGLMGRRADAFKILTEMEQVSKHRYISPFYLAAVESGLGRMDDAFRLLDQALQQRTPWLVICVPNDPLSFALRRDPRWKPFVDRLRRQVRLPPGTPDPYS